MPDITAKAGPKQSTIEAEIIRADGTRVPLGQISHSYNGRNPLRRVWMWYQTWLAQRRIRRANKKLHKDTGWS